MKAKLFKFNIIDFEEVYTIIDDENKRLHISSVNYNYNLTLDLRRDLKEQIKQLTQWGEKGFNERVRKVLQQIVEELN